MNSKFLTNWSEDEDDLQNHNNDINHPLFLHHCMRVWGVYAVDDEELTRVYSCLFVHPVVVNWASWENNVNVEYWTAKPEYKIKKNKLPFAQTTNSDLSQRPGSGIGVAVSSGGSAIVTVCWGATSSVFGSSVSGHADLLSAYT